MYELKLNEKQHIAFCNVVKDKLKERDMRINELAYALNRPVKSVYRFFTDMHTPNRFLAAEICDLLGIERSEYNA